MTDSRTVPEGQPKGTCSRHGGPWGQDETCPRCTYTDGRVRPAADPGPLTDDEIDDAGLRAFSPVFADEIGDMEGFAAAHADDY